MSNYIELEPTFDHSNGAIISEGDPVFVRGIGNRMLGIGTFAGNLVLAACNNDVFQQPIIEVQGKLVSGGQVDLWSTEPDLIEQHRDTEVYPIDQYLADIKKGDAEISAMIDTAYSNQWGVYFE
jgi:hypothetical protein